MVTFDRRILLQFSRQISYKQGQIIGKHREYFYFIDNNGQLFLDDMKIKNFTSSYKDTQFLDFFFTRLKLNETDRYQKEFPYVSLCGREMNFLRCGDRPVVFTSLNADDDSWNICNCTLKVPFKPEYLCMFANGRLYHPAALDKYGLVKSKLSSDIFHHFIFDDDEQQPTHFKWKGTIIKLKNKF